MAIAFDVGGKSTVQASISNYSFTGPTLGSLSNGIVFVLVQSRGVASDGNLVITGITYDGSAMTLAKAQLEPDSGGSTGSLSSEIWYLKNPPSGAKTVAITFTGTVNHSTAYVGSFSGVDQTSPINASAGSGDAENASPTSTITQNITTTVANCFIVDSIYHKTSNALTPGAGQTVIAAESEPNGGGDTSDASYKGPVSSGANSTSWTLTGNDGWVIANVAFAPAGISSAIISRGLLMMGVGN
jgi:hypothetical protein